jgi:hypothetical protein
MEPSKREKEFMAENERLRTELSSCEKEKFDLTSKVAALQDDVQKRV